MNRNLLFSDYTLHSLKLENRMVMAPLTRSRALNNLPNELMAEYYNQRRTAGLIISEGVAPSPHGIGYPRIPGIYSEEQVNEWKEVFEFGKMSSTPFFIQLWHVGRVSVSENQPKGSRILAPSPISADKEIHTDSKGMQKTPIPEEMSIEDIELTKKEFVRAARNSVDAGASGVELHGANGYLFQQFLNPASNKRTDIYGGSRVNRRRFLLETVEAVAREIGEEKVGIRFSPYGEFNGAGIYDDIHETYTELAELFNSFNLAYIHLNSMASSAAKKMIDTRLEVREIYDNILILCGGYDKEAATEALRKDEADLIAFGRPFISNPDLVHRYKNDLPLNESRTHLYYTKGAEGYTDYEFSDGN